MCGQDRCLENRDEQGVGYCYRYSTMHRHGKPFIKKGEKPVDKAEKIDVRQAKSSSSKNICGQMEFGFDENDELMCKGKQERRK
jgi:hypothetical protein